VKVTWHCLKSFFAVSSVCFFLGCLGDRGENSGLVDAGRGRSPEAIVAECALCHGTKEAQRAPILDGMEYWYLLDQIQKFHSGVRGQSPENRSEYLMGSAAKKLRSDFEMAFAASWFAKQERKPAIRTVRGDIESGAKLYEERCASCHGSNAEGNATLMSPSLASLEGWYFLDQMRKFRSRSRGNSPADAGGQIMAAASAGLTNRQLRDVVAYVVEEFGPPEAPSLRDELLKRFAEGREANATIPPSSKP